MSAPTPTDAEVRGRYCDGVYLQTGHTTEGEDFDRWLTRHDAEIRRAAEQQEADPLDESDHRVRHDADGDHVYYHGPGHWHAHDPSDGIPCPCPGYTLIERADDYGPLTFCDCP